MCDTPSRNVPRVHARVWCVCVYTEGEAALVADHCLILLRARCVAKVSSVVWEEEEMMKEEIWTFFLFGGRATVTNNCQRSERPASRRLRPITCSFHNFYSFCSFQFFFMRAGDDDGA